MTPEQLTKLLPTPISQDEEAFTHSFDWEEAVNNPDAIRNFFQEYGVVVVRNVLSEDKVKASRDDFFRQFDSTNNESTTAFLKGPENPFSRMGIIGRRSDFSVAQLVNRQNERVYEVFKAIYDDDRLIVDHDRIGAMRPTLQSDGTIKSEWQTINNWLHLDCNPATGEITIGSMDASALTYRNPHNFDKEAQFLVQGFLALSDAREQDGGFLCIPGSHKITKEWAIQIGWGKQHRHFPGQLRPTPDDPLQQNAQPITVRSGSLVIWNSFTLHANHSNTSNRWRLVQYIRMYPERATRFKPLVPNKDGYPKEFIESMITPLGRRLFGIDSWEDSEDEREEIRDAVVT